MNQNNKTEAAVTNGFLFTAAQRGIDKNGDIISSDITVQAVKAMQNLEKVLIDNNSSFAKVQKITLFFSRHEDFLPCNLAVRQCFISKNLPVPKCSSVETEKLPPDVFVEIEAVAKV